MYITITIQINDSKYDIRIDKRQRIFTALEILKQSGKAVVSDFPLFYKSYENEKLISTYNTFEECGIFSGDILKAVI